MTLINQAAQNCSKGFEQFPATGHRYPLRVGAAPRSPICKCGCRTRANWVGMIHGTVHTEGCEFAVKRWCAMEGNPP